MRHLRVSDIFTYAESILPDKQYRKIIQGNCGRNKLFPIQRLCEVFQEVLRHPAKRASQ